MILWVTIRCSECGKIVWNDEYPTMEGKFEGLTFTVKPHTCESPVTAGFEAEGKETP